MNEGERRLWKDLAYLGENFDFNDPEDAWAKREYKRIKKLLGIDGKVKANRERVKKLRLSEGSAIE